MIAVSEWLANSAQFAIGALSGAIGMLIVVFLALAGEDDDGDAG